MTAQTEDPEVPRFGIISTKSTTGLRRDFSPFLEALEAKIELPVKVRFASDYAGAFEAMQFGRLLWDAIRSFDYSRTSAILLIIIVVVMTLNAISSQVRKRSI